MDYSLLDDQIKKNISDQRKQALQAEHYGLELRIKELESTGAGGVEDEVARLRASQTVLDTAYAVHNEVIKPDEVQA